MGHELIGKRVQIRAIKMQGSARRLNGLTGTVIGLHPLVPGWLQLELEPNNITPHQLWTIPFDRLVLCPGSATTIETKQQKSSVFR